ncbi:sigma-70 family RNA polymerase sigma factor [bacterium]|nr:sigma-70 family RNA polymerase sigma factor [bacterium]MBU1985284.1 sigma-70 family RNA polymerase sigma factor [bacterium]
MVDRKVGAPTDEDLILAFQNGDVSAFEEIVRRYRDPLFNFVVRLLGDAFFSEDIVQETFLRVYRNRHRYHQVAKFSTWIYTIASNLAKTELRRRKVRNFFSISSKGEDEKDYDLVDVSTDIERDVDGILKGEIILKEINALPLHFREAVLLRDIQDLSYEEISQILNVPLGTVKSRVNRGRSRLQKKLRFLVVEESEGGKRNEMDE